MCCGKPDEPEHFLDPAPHFVERHVGLLVHLEADVLADRDRVEQRAFLEHHAHVMAHAHQLLFRHRIHAMAEHPHGA